MDYALITGASGGIGFELSVLFAQKGYNLILVSRNKNKLQQAQDTLKSIYNCKILIIPIDLSQAETAEQIYSIIFEKSIFVQFLVNNAGFYIKGAFEETSWEDELKLIQVQCISHTRLTKLLLPEMMKRKTGGILNIGSTGSFVPGPYNAIYCASKSFVLSFSEALAEEVSKSGITVTALCPGGTKTAFQEFNDTKRSVLFPVMEASKVAKIGFKALLKGKRLAIPGAANKLQVFLIRFMPRKIVTRMLRSVMNN